MKASKETKQLNKSSIRVFSLITLTDEEPMVQSGRRWSVTCDILRCIKKKNNNDDDDVALSFRHPQWIINGAVSRLQTVISHQADISGRQTDWWHSIDGRVRVWKLLFKVNLFSAQICHGAILVDGMVILTSLMFYDNKTTHVGTKNMIQSVKGGRSFSIF